MELRQVQGVLAIVETGSFSAAADELYLSQSSLSKLVIALERELGVTLFDRGRRKVALTPTGEAFLPHARVLDATYRALLADLGEFHTRSPLAIVAIPVIAQYGMATTVAQFRNVHPEITLTLEEREPAAILPALHARQFDLAFVRDNYLNLTQYLVRPVVSDRLVLVVSRQHRLAAHREVAVAELANENHIVFDRGTIVHELVIDTCRAAGFEPRIFYASLRVESVLGMVASNSGVALMMEKVVAYHQNPGVIVVPLAEEIASNVVLVAPATRKLAWPARQFLEFIGQRSSALPAASASA